MFFYIFRDLWFPFLEKLLYDHLLLDQKSPNNPFLDTFPACSTSIGAANGLLSLLEFSVGSCLQVTDSRQ